MFNTLSRSFTNIFNRLTGRTLSENDIKLLLLDIKNTLIDSDTATEAADYFIEQIKNDIMQQNFSDKINIQQQIQSHIHKSLVNTLGQPPSPILKQSSPISIILLAGLQGAGKTTTAVKLGKWITNNLHKKVAVTSLDFQRPAAREQLKILAMAGEIEYIHAENEELSALRASLIQATKASGAQTLILDTAGRLHLDSELMQDLSDIQQTFNPDEVILVMDSQTGQDAAISAKKFNEKIALTSCILSKCDADSKGGAALSIRTITQKPISFIGTGEKLNDLETFNPETIANQMLDLGNIDALVAKLKKNIDPKDAARQAKKISKGHYDLTDFMVQIQHVKKMGGTQSFLNMLPGVQSLPDSIKEMINDNHSKIYETLILSMTPKERRHPMLLSQQSRRDRVLRGSGRSKKELQNLLKQYEKMHGMIKKMNNSKIKLAIRMMNQKKT